MRDFGQQTVRAGIIFVDDLIMVIAMRSIGREMGNTYMCMLSRWVLIQKTIMVVVLSLMVIMINRVYM